MSNLHEKLLQRTYSEQTVNEWRAEKGMEHASGIWGRIPFLRYLEKHILKPGQRIVDFGCGGGYVSAQIAEMASEGSTVTGIELSKAQLGLETDDPIAKQYEHVKNLSFIHGDIRHTTIDSESVDVIVSSMVLHNLPIEDVILVFREANRILRHNGTAVFLTMHPEMFDSPWNVNFWTYDQEDLQAFASAAHKEGIKMEGKVTNSGGGQKTVFLIYHTREHMLQALQESNLHLIEEQNLYIDQKEAEEKFRKENAQQVPQTPVFWILTVQKDIEP